MVQEERLDPHYFSTTPKSSWELFIWGFSETSKIDIFTKNFTRKKAILLFLKIYFWVTIISFSLYLIIKSIFVYFDIPLKYSSYFKDEFIIEWQNLITFYDKFIFDVTVMYVLFFFSLLLLVFGIIGRIFKSDFKEAIRNLLFTFSISIIFGFPIEHFKGDVIVISIMGISLLLLQLNVLFAIYVYPYYAIKDLFVKPTLDNNAYLKNSQIRIPIRKLKKYLSEDSFNRPHLADSFIKFLLEFRTGKRKLAFYLSNVSNASNFYHDKLSIKSIKIPNNYEWCQPTEKFTKILQKLKDELGSYQKQNNIHHQVDSYKRIVELLKDLEQQMLIEKRGWSEYYLKAIRANLDEANARLKNLELEAKNIEPITPNIYEIGNPLSPNYQNKLFKGRKDLVGRLSNIIYTSQQMPLLLIQGQRRVGKTSLINYLEQLLGSGFKIVKLDMQSATNKRFNSLVKNINEELNSMLGIEESIETTDDILESWIAFESYLTRHTKVLNYKIIIAFDEYEAFHKHIIKKNSDGEDILESMRSFMQSQNQVIFLFSGMLRLSDLTAPNWDEYFPQAQRLKVDYLSKEESYELITNPVEDFNLIYTDALTDEVYKLTMGHPQLLQTICSIIVTLANESNQKNVTPEMVANAKEQVFEVNEMPMTIFWREFCGNEEREVMEQILAHHEVQRETQEQKRAVARLVDYGFISKEFDIFVPLFVKWLVERRDLIEI